MVLLPLTFHGHFQLLGAECFYDFLLSLYTPVMFGAQMYQLSLACGVQNTVGSYLPPQICLDAVSSVFQFLCSLIEWLFVCFQALYSP